MPEFLKAIKQASVEAVNSTQPSAPFVGTVATASPLSVRLDQRLTVSKEHLVVMAAAGDAVVGDKVAVIRFAGGQRYLVLGKVRQQ